MESLSKVPFYVPLIVYIPVIAWFVWKSFSIGFSIWSVAADILLGLAVWTITEYVMHRFVFHFHPTSTWGKRIHFIFHGVHHDYPNDAGRLVMPPSASIPLASLFFLFFYLLIGNYSFPVFIGFISGYLAYDMIHYALHHYNFKSEFWKRLKKHHMLHHYADDTRGYGVTSGMWDKVFKSDFIKK
jgi:sterol desaturase/sphingolipid hydroxylase (fatty acid hydroxylase superfamily)